MSDSTSDPARQKRTLVEDGTELKGTISSKCPIVVMGKIEGEVSGPSIHVSPSGVVAGTVKVVELHSEGELAGAVEADTVHLSGRVRDSTVIHAKTLEVVAGDGDAMQVIFGECELAVGDEPSKEAAIAAALASHAPAPAPAPVAVAAAPTATAPAPAPTAPAPVTALTGPVAEAGWEEGADGNATDDGASRGKRGRNRGTLPPPPT